MVAFFSSHLVTHNPLRSDFLYLYFSEVISFIPLKIGRKHSSPPAISVFSKVIFYSSRKLIKKKQPLPQPRFSGYLVTSYSQYQVLDQVWKPEEQLSTQECSGNDQLS